MKPRKDRKFSRLRGRFPLGALVMVTTPKRLYHLDAPEKAHTLGIVVGTWRMQRVSRFQSKTTDNLGEDPRSRTSKNATGYLLLMSSVDTPLERQVFDVFNVSNVTLVSTFG